MALSKIEKLEQQLAAAQKAARKVPTPLQYAQIIPTYDPAADSLAAALAYKATLIQNVKAIDIQLVALANDANVKYEAIINEINAYGKLVPDASESDYQELLVKIASAENRAGMVKLTDYTQNYRYGDLKKERNVAISALSAHLQIIEALEAVI